MNAKASYPFDPFVDSLLGEKIMFVWKSSNQSSKDLLDALLSKTNQTAFTFTPNATKQTLMVSIPVQIRTLHSEKNLKEIGEILIGLADGSLTENKLPAVDITFELVEWLLTGFDMDEAIADYLNLLFGKEQIIDVAFVEKIRSEYIKEMRG